MTSGLEEGCIFVFVLFKLNESKDRWNVARREPVQMGRLKIQESHGLPDGS